MSIAMVGGLLVSSIVTGRIISNTGLWKRFLVGGMVLVVVGLSLLGTIDATTPLVEVGAFMAVLGLGLGATMQNLVLAVQNNTAQADMGAASSVVAFFRSMGGSIGVSALGALLSHQVTQKVDRRAGGDRHRPAGHSSRLDPRPRPRCRRRSARSTRPRSARPPATCSWSRRRSRCSPWSASCSSGGAAAHHARTARTPEISGTLHPWPATELRRGRASDDRAAADSLRQPRARGRRADPPDQAGHRRAGPRGPPGPAAGVVPDAHLAGRRGPGPGLGDGRELRHRQGRDQPPAPAPRRPRPGRPHARPRRRPGHPGRGQRRRRTPARRRRRRTAASGSTSSSATGRPTSSTDLRGHAAPLQRSRSNA